MTRELDTEPEVDLRSTTMREGSNDQVICPKCGGAYRYGTVCDPGWARAGKKA
jgi:hypothetical protein